jgi:outer membrane protein OmpA-like peptidoglycan-associated protein/tetratricopeptide (TPR) repeat protein
MTQGRIIRIGLLIAIIFGLNSISFAQITKANKYFEQDQFSDAIVYYNKVLKKDASNKEATQNIAFSYRKLKDYENAEVYYAKATELSPEESSNYLYYGQTLKNNDKIKEAKTQFEKYVAKNPSSFMGKLMVQSCGDVKNWEFQEKEFSVSILENINTKNADFCPLVYDGGIVFVSERGIDLVNENEFGMSNKPYLSIYFAKEEKQYKKAKRFSNQLNSIYHDGPVSISSDNSIIYFTRVDKKEQGKNYTNRLKIYSAELNGKKWKKVTPFKYNSNDYSVAHPWLSDDGTKLFFASDMGGGQGKMDIYVCTKDGDEWGKPVNLGENINTPENEVFPYYRKGTLYFSSEGHSGYGGLDIYSSKEEGKKWKNSKNLKSPLNSSKDDFGIFYNDDENGYFSSDREGGVGSDDIYKFTWQSLDSLTTLSGLLEYDKLGAGGTTINLLDEDDNVISTMVTDEYGNFKFDKLDVDKNYLITIDATDDSFLENAKLYLTNSSGEKVLIANKVSKGKFQFQALPYTYYDQLELLVEDDESLLTVTVFGQIYKKLPGDYTEGMEVLVVDDEGNIIGRAIADKDGKFTFDKLSPDEEYLFMLAEDDKALNMVIYSENGDVAEEAKKLLNGVYSYVKLQSGKNLIALVNEEDEVIKISENDNFSISKIFYAYKSAEINNTSAAELDKLVLILKKNKDIEITISSHADAIGSDMYNMRLSQRRGENVVNYVISKGIAGNRISSKSYGETQPIAPNLLPNGEDNPEGRAKNRRTEFKIKKLK